MHLLELPTELLHAVCTFCTKREIQDARLTCQNLRRIADEHLLDEVVTCLERQDLNTLFGIAKAAPIFRNNIKSFVFQADGFPLDEQWSRHEWIRVRKSFFDGVEQTTKSFMRSLLPKSGNNRRIEVLESLLRYYQLSADPSLMLRPEKVVSHQKYFELAADQVRLVREGLIERSTREVFTSCPNIKSLTINSGHKFRRHAGLTNLAYLRSLTIPQDTVFVAYALKTSLAAVASSGTRLDSLFLGGVESWFLRRGARWTEDYDTLITNLYKTTANLKILHLRFNAEDDADEELYSYYGKDEFAQGHLAKWLQNCAQIQDLRLALPRAPAVYTPSLYLCIPIEHVLGNDFHLTSLGILHLRNFTAAAESLAQLLLRHGTSLTELELDNAWLSRGMWQNCLGMFAGKLERLQHVRFRGTFSDSEPAVLYEAQFNVEAERYILSGTDIPDLESLRVELDESESEDDDDEDDEESGDEDELTESSSTDEEEEEAVDDEISEESDEVSDDDA